MNFSSGSSTSRNHLLRAGLQGTKFSSTNNNSSSTTSTTPVIVKPEFLNLTATNIINGSSNNNNNNSNNNNDNNLKNTSGAPTFLTISKSRVPDITMINKYYGLVPKKFVINARSDFSSKPTIRLRPRTTHSFDEETTESLLDENLVTKNRNKEVHEHGHSNNKNVFRRSSSTTNCEDGVTADVNGLVARRMPVEKHKKLRRIKNCGRSLSMMDNSESMGTTMGGSHRSGCKHHSTNNASMADRMEIQRVIKIDLNHMRWEESYHDRCKTECADTGGVEEDVNDSSCEVVRSPTSPPASSVRRGFLRKTISFDDQIMRIPSDETQPKKQAGEKADLRPSRRPTTALPSSSSGLSAPQPLSPPAPLSTPKVTPWTSRTGQSLADRRSKFQKSFSIYQDSFDNGESDNEPESCEGSSILSASIKCRESKKSLHVQAPPEISTMISLISPAPPPDHEDDLQAEIDKVDSIINTCHNRIAEVEEKLAFDEVPTSSAQREKEEEQGDNETTEKGGKVGQELLDSKNNSLKPENIKPDKPDARKTPTNAETTPVKSKKILKKAASISCENELIEPKKQVRARPQTSRPKNTVSFSTSNSTRYIPSRRENSTFARSATISKDAPAGGSASSRASSPEGPSPGLRNRKILIKKALIEINQSSINLGKKGNHVRPKTAPIPDKKSTPASTPQVQKRQPLKASPPMKMPSLVRNNSSSLSSNMELHKHTTTGKTTKEVSPEPEPEPSPPKVRAIPRKSLSMTDGFLHGFGHEAPADIDNSEIIESLTNSKKREECLKVYEKMMKKGCNVKLETIFRGLMTPSEYRMFMEAKELAEKKAMEEAEVENINPGDAGISSSQEDSIATS